MERRETGALETEVLGHLWAADTPLTPRAVSDALGGELAYTTVLTILMRLHHKGLVDRERRGRAYAYRPVVSEAELTAQRMRRQLERAGDREAALSQFVGSLTRRDERALRRIIAELERGR